MKEIVLQNKKHGMRTLLVCSFIELLAIVGCIVLAVLVEQSETHLETPLVDTSHCDRLCHFRPWV